MNTVCRVAVLLACAQLAACVTPPSREPIDLPDLSTAERRLQVLGDLEDWEFRGRIAVDAGDDGFNGKLRWTQTGASFSATVGGPLGIGTVRIAGQGTAATLTDKDGVSVQLADAESELRARYGWTLPMRSLRYWALGIPDPALPAEIEFSADGQLIRLLQSGWDVAVPRYKDAAGQKMPRRLDARNENTRVRLVIDSWYFFK